MKFYSQTALQQAGGRFRALVTDTSPNLPERAPNPPETDSALDKSPGQRQPS
jgi:hypothetical protein